MVKYYADVMKGQRDAYSLSLDFRNWIGEAEGELYCCIRVVVPILVTLLCLYRAVLGRCWPVGERGLAALESVEAEMGSMAFSEIAWSSEFEGRHE